MKPIFAAVRFLTVLPVPEGWCGDASALGRSAMAFPLVGLLIGAIAAAAAWGLGAALSPLAASVLVVLLLVAASGGLHMDGLADTADGFFSARPREQTLRIMRDSRVGTMGVLAIVFVLLLKVALLAELAAEVMWIAALLLPLAGRCAMVIAMHAAPYAGPAEGLGRVFHEHRCRSHVVLAVVVLGVLAVALAGWTGVLLTAAVVAMAVGMAAYAYRRIGGGTGDTYGATCEVAETLPLLILIPLFPADG